MDCTGNLLFIVDKMAKGADGTRISKNISALAGK